MHSFTIHSTSILSAAPRRAPRITSHEMLLLDARRGRRSLDAFRGTSPIRSHPFVHRTPKEVPTTKSTQPARQGLWTPGTMPNARKTQRHGPAAPRRPPLQAELKHHTQPAPGRENRTTASRRGAGTSAKVSRKRGCPGTEHGAGGRAGAQPSATRKLATKAIFLFQTHALHPPLKPLQRSQIRFVVLSVCE